MGEGIKTRRGKSKGQVISKTYLYNKGDKNIALTGGYNMVALDGGSGWYANRVTFDDNAQDITISIIASTANARAAGFVETVNSIDLTNYDTLNIDVELVTTGAISLVLYTGSTMQALSDNYTATFTAYIAVLEQYTGTISLDISAVSGGYCGIRILSSYNYPAASCKLNKMWLE